MKYPPKHLTPFLPSFPRKIAHKFIAPATFSATTTPTAPLSTFRMNTCKSVSKQRTLTPFRMNTYAKTGGGRCLLLTSHPLQTRRGSSLRSAVGAWPAPFSQAASHPLPSICHSPCFQKLANPSSSNPFIFTSIQNPRGVTLTSFTSSSALLLHAIVTD